MTMVRIKFLAIKQVDLLIMVYLYIIRNVKQQIFAYYLVTVHIKQLILCKINFADTHQDNMYFLTLDHLNFYISLMV